MSSGTSTDTVGGLAMTNPDSIQDSNLPDDGESPDHDVAPSNDLKQLVIDYMRRKFAGEDVTVESVCARYAHLQPELEEHLRRAQQIVEADKSGLLSFADGSATTGPDDPTAGLRFRCPHCQQAVELVVATNKYECRNCGSHINVLRDVDSVVPPSIAQEIEHFQFESILGVGDFGTVWKAHDCELDGRKSRYKIPRMGHLDRQHEELFLREARVAAQLKHPNIVSVHEVGRVNDTLYIVSDLVDGAAPIQVAQG